MELTDTFALDCGYEEAWDLLVDVARIAPCVPGATLTETEDTPSGPRYVGLVAVRLGALSTRFQGYADVQADPDRRRIVVRAEGDGDHGAGEAVITATLEPISDLATQVNVDTDLTITGHVARLGRRIIPEVSTVLTAQFAEGANRLLRNETPEPDPFRSAAGVAMPEPEVLDLYDAARRPIMKRLVPLAGVMVAAGVVRRLRRAAEAYAQHDGDL